jgi:hypothetical protein
MGCGGSKAATETVVEPKPSAQAPVSAPEDVQAQADEAEVQALKQEIAQKQKEEEDLLAEKAKAAAEEKAAAEAAREAEAREAAAAAAAAKKKADDEAKAALEKLAPPPIPEPTLSVETEAKGDDAAVTQPEPNEADSYASLQPNIGFVVKSKRQTDKSKVFINIFYHERLASMISTAAKTSKDKNGNDCLAYDVIIPYNSFVDCAEDEIVRNKLCLEAIELVNSLYFDSLSQDYIVPKMKRGYVGDSIEFVDVPIALIMGEKKPVERDDSAKWNMGSPAKQPAEPAPPTN